jgi:succinate dehydrogenase / fumarate reductase, cytochrome b subunit
MMADVKRVERPLSPHLQIYRPQMTSITSILTRITGNGLIVGAMLAVWWLLAAACRPSISRWPMRWRQAGSAIWSSPLSAWALWYHYLAGLRHLYFDAGKGWIFPTAEKLGWACIIGSVVLTVLTIIIV